MTRKTITQKEKRKRDEAIGWFFAGVLLIGYLWLVKWLIDEYFFAILLLAAGVFPLLIFITGVGMVVSLVALIAGKK